MRLIYWSLVRLLFLVFAIIAILSGGLLVFPLSPIYSWYFFHDLHFWRYTHLVFPTVITGIRILIDTFRNPGYRDSFIVSLTAQPMLTPDASRMQVRDDWPINDGSCNSCIHCCVQRQCTLIDMEKNRCLSYGSFFWRFFNCGRYPEYHQQIKFYDCPKWEELEWIKEIKH